MAKLLASKIVIQEEVTSLRSIPATATAIIGVCGVAERGPIATATLITSWEEYVKTFGSYTADGELPMAVRGIYKQDRSAWVQVVRTVHYDPDATDPANKTSAQAEVNVPATTATASAGQVTGNVAGPWNLEPGWTLDIHVDEDVGGSEVATWDAARATAAGSGLAIVDLTGDTLILSIDGGDSQTITFAGTEATAQDVANTINASLLGGVAVVNAGEVDIKGSIRGTDGEVDITGGTALGEIGHSIGTDNGTGDVANINAVTLAEVQAVIATDIVTATVTVTEESGTGYLVITSDTTGSTSSVMIEVASTADGAFGLDNTLHSGADESSATTFVIKGKTDGTYAHNYPGIVSAPTNGEADYFDYTVTDSDGNALESYPNLQVSDTTADDYIETVVNATLANGGSKYHEIEDQLTTETPDNGTYTPASGDDGLTDLADTDFLGDSAGGTGIHAFDQLDEDITILTIPGRATSAIHNGMITYCESDKSGLCFAVLDCPAGLTAAQMVTYTETTAALIEASEYAAIYWPRIKVLNPSKTVYGSDDQITVPPAAWIAGVYSRVDSATEGGIYKPPAGIERGVINGHLGFETEEVLDVAKRDLIYPKLINPISKEKGTPRFIDGTKTLKSGGDFPRVSERRGVIYIERSLQAGLVFARHSNIDDKLLSRCFRTTYQFLKQQMKLGAFRTTDPETAFFVDFSDALNPPSERFNNKVNGRIGLATQKPADYVILTVSQDTRLLDEELAG